MGSCRLDYNVLVFATGQLQNGAVGGDVTEYLECLIEVLS